MIKIVKTKNEKHTKLDVNFSSFEEAVEYFNLNILPKDTNRYISYTYKISKIHRAKIKEYLFLDSDDMLLYSYKIIKTYE